MSRAVLHILWVWTKLWPHIPIIVMWLRVLSLLMKTSVLCTFLSANSWQPLIFSLSPEFFAFCRMAYSWNLFLSPWNERFRLFMRPLLAHPGVDQTSSGGKLPHHVLRLSFQHWPCPGATCRCRGCELAFCSQEGHMFCAPHQSEPRFLSGVL